MAKTIARSTNEQVKDQGKSVNQQQSCNEALSKIKSATKDCRLSSSSTDIQSFSSNLNSNFSEQQSVGQEIAKTKQNMQQLSYNRIMYHKTLLLLIAI
ncbi:MAG: hypothetical protein MRQ07_03275 [Candidatus Midichloria sp.]|nr:hypothetical protein [Candidatus Midichloria sp.]